MLRKLILFLGLFCSGTAFAEPANVKVEVVELKTFNYTEKLLGTIKPKFSAALKARKNGTLEWIVEPNAEVKKGDVVFKISANDSSNTLDIAKENLEFAKKNYHRATELIKTRLITQQQYLADKQKYLDAQKSYQEAKTDFDAHVITAPFDGIVGVPKVRVGSEINNSEDVVMIYDQNQLVVELGIPESLIKRVKIGQKVSISNEEFKIDALQKAIEEKTHMAPALINYKCIHCLPGEVVDVEIVVEEKPNTILIPMHIVMFKNGKPYVFCVDENNKTVTAFITLGGLANGIYEVTEGLEVGDKLVTQGLQRLNDGAEVTIYEGQ